MPEISSPAAPAVQTSAPPAAAPATARNNAGQFSPKDGAQATPPPATKTAAPPAPPESYRFKKKIGEREYDLGEPELERHIGELEWRRKQQAEVAAAKREADELVRLAREDEDAFFKKLGIDVDARAERKLAERMRLSQLTPEQQELERAKAELAEGRKSIEAEKKRIADTQRQAERARVQAQNRQEYEQALGHSALPHSRAKLFLMTQIQKGQQENGAPRLNPEQLGRAYDELMFSAFDEMVRSSSTKAEALSRWPDLPKLATSSLEKLDGAALLQALGPALKRKVLEASVAEFRGQQTIPVRHGGGEPPPPAKSTGPIDEVQLEERKRAFLKSL